MTIHTQQHSLKSTIDHGVGTTPGAGQHNIVGTSDAPAIVELIVEAPADTPASSTVVKRQTDGHIKVPTAGHATDEAVNLGTVETLIANGVMKSAVHSVVAVHNAVTVGDGTPNNGAPGETQLTDVALAVDDLVINTTDNKVYKVTSIAGGTTGDLATWDAGTAPSTAQLRLSTSSENTWSYDVEGATWVNQGSSNHSRSHAMTGASDHTASNWKMFHSNGAAQVLELTLSANVNAPLLSGGATANPIFGTLLFAPAPIACAGATPVDSDVSSWSNNTIGICTGTGGRIFAAYKNSVDVYYVELGAI